MTGFPDYFTPEETTGLAPINNLVTDGLGGPLVLTDGLGGYGEVTYPTLAKAIIARFRASEYYSLLRGGLHYPDAPNPAKNNPPYGVLQEVTETTNYSTKGRSYLQHYWQISFFAPLGMSLELSQIKEGWYSVFDPVKLLANPLLWNGYRLVRLANSDARVMEDDRDAPAGPGQASLPSVQQIIEFLVIYSPRAN